jgi:hypothetical protein
MTRVAMNGFGRRPPCLSGAPVLLGSDGHQCAHHAPWPVVLVHTKPKPAA